MPLIPKQKPKQMPYLEVGGLYEIERDNSGVKERVLVLADKMYDSGMQQVAVMSVTFNFEVLSWGTDDYEQLLKGTLVGRMINPLIESFESENVIPFSDQEPAEGTDPLDI